MGREGVRCGERERVRKQKLVKLSIQAISVMLTGDTVAVMS
jgi:hypothetical protein